MMLDRGDDHPPALSILRPSRPVEALDREIVRFRSATGEDHLRRPGAERLCHRLPGFLDDSARSASRAMQWGWVAEPPELSRHSLDGLVEHRGGCGVI